MVAAAAAAAETLVEPSKGTLYVMLGCVAMTDHMYHGVGYVVVPCMEILHLAVGMALDVQTALCV